MTIGAAAVSATLRRRTIFAVGGCLGLIALADFLFYDHPLGWTVGLFGFATLTLLTLRGGELWRGWTGRALALGNAGLAVACIEQPGPLTITLGFVALLTVALLSRGGWTAGAGAWFTRTADILWRLWLQLPIDVRLRHRWLRARTGRASWWQRLLVGWTAPVALSLVFVGFFWLANPVISRWMGRFGTWLSEILAEIEDLFRPGRIALWLIVGFASWGLLRVRSRRRRADGLVIPPSPIPTAALELNGNRSRHRFLLRSLILFNLVFAVQTGLDVVYLWGGAELPDGMTYAQYARRGAFPLVATALLAAAFVLITFRTNDNGAGLRWPKRLVYLWIAQNVFLTVSAAWRLWLYVEALSLTRLRLAAAIWMMLVAFGLVTIVWRMVTARSNDWVLGVNTLTTVAVLYVCCFIDFDATIARSNVTRCREVGGPGGPIDIEYLRHLGPETLPALRWLADRATEPGVADAARRTARTLSQELEEDLSDWRGWTLRRARLARANKAAVSRPFSGSDH